MKQLTVADGIFRLGGEELPGLLRSLRVDGKVRYDSQKVDGTSGKSKTPLGWEDQVVILQLVLLTEEETDCYDKLEVIASHFKKPDTKANPQIYTIVNRHVQTRGIRQVIFDRLESTENSQNDTISVSLGFSEHLPPIIRTEAAVAKTPTNKEAATEKNLAKPEEEASITEKL